MNFPKIYRRFAFLAVGVLLVGLFPAAAMADENETFSFVFTASGDPLKTPVSTVVAGDTLDVVVTAHVGSSSETDTGYIGTVTFTSHDVLETPPPDCEFDAGVCNSVASVMIFQTVGTERYLTATDVDVSANTSDSGWVDVRHAGALHLDLTPPTGTITAGGSKTYTVTAHDGFNNSWDATSDTNLSIDGGAGTGSCVGDTCTSTLAGDRTVTGTDGSGTGSASLHVNAGGAYQLRVTPATSTVDADHSQTYQVQTADTYNNPIDDVTADATLGITGTGTSCNNGTHSCTSTKAGGPYSVTASYETYSGGASLTVTAGAVFHLILNPTTNTIDADHTQTYAVYTADHHDNEIALVTNSTTLTIDAPGTCNDSTHSCTSATASGPLTVTGHYSTYTGTAQLTVIHGAATHLVLTPSSGSTTTDARQAYSVASVDANGNTVADVTGSTHFTIVGTGTSCDDPSHSCTSTTVGNGYVVTAHASGLTGTATLDVTVGAANHLVLTPSSGSTTTDASQAYTVESFDFHNNQIADVTGSTHFTIVGTGTSCDDPSHSCTSTKVGSGYVVTAHASGVTGTATLDVTVGAAHHLLLTPSSSSITTDATQPYSAEKVDAHDNAIADVTGTTHFAIVGTGTSCDDPSHSCTSTTVGGPFAVTASDNGLEGTASLTVTVGALAKLVLSPGTASIKAGDHQPYTVQGADAHDNLIVGDLTASTTLTITGAGNSCENVTHTCTGTTPDSGYVVTGTYNLITGTAILDIGPADLSYLVLSPASHSITADNSQSYTVEGFDSFNFDLGNMTSLTTLTIDGTGFCDNIAKSCTSHTPGGPFTVTGTIGSAHGTASLTVTVGAATHFSVVPFAGGPAPITGSVTVTALDQHDNTATGYAGIVKITSSDGGAVLPANAPLGAGTGIGTFNVTLITAGSQTVTATDTVTPSMTGTSVGTVLTRTVSEYHAVTPVRLLDTRLGQGVPGGNPQRLKPHQHMTIQIAGRGNVSMGASAVTVNVTVVQASVTSTLFLGPVAIDQPTTFSAAFNKTDNTAYGLTVALSPTGTVSATYMAGSGTTDLLLDVTGFFMPNDTTGNTYFPVAPARLLDSRVKTDHLYGKFKPATPRTFTVWGRGDVPSTAVAVTGNLTVTGSTYRGAVYLGPDPLKTSPTSTINFMAGQIRANTVTVPLNRINGTLSATFLASAGTTDLVFDVTGYYVLGTSIQGASGAKYVPLPSATVLDTRPSGNAGRAVANTPMTFAVRNHAGVPSTANGITGVIGVSGQTDKFAMFAGPDPIAFPTTSTFNFVKTDNLSNGITVALSGSGSLSVTYMAATGNHAHVIVYVTGYFVPPPGP